MAPRGHTLPQATTESAREARKNFFCELCQKGYARMNEFEAHEGSYDHQHRKRLKDMRQLTKDPNAAAKARAAEQKAKEEAGLTTINLMPIDASTAAPKKKAVFKSTLQPQNAGLLGGKDVKSHPVPEVLPDNGDPSGAVRNGWFEERYQPQFITGCDDPRCRACKDGHFDLGAVDTDTRMKETR